MQFELFPFFPNRFLKDSQKNILCENEKSLTIPRYSLFAIQASFFGGKKMLVFHFEKFNFFTFVCLISSYVSLIHRNMLLIVFHWLAFWLVLTTYICWIFQIEHTTVTDKLKLSNSSFSYINFPMTALYTGICF